MSTEVTGDDPNKVEMQLALYEIVETEADEADIHELAADQIRTPRRTRLELHIAQVRKLLPANPPQPLGHNVVPLKFDKAQAEADTEDGTGEGTA